MPTFIDMSALTKRTTLTGNEEFQVSATEKVTAQQIADLATRGLSIITVTNFNTRTWTGGKSASEMVEGEIQAFISAANTTGAPSNSAYRGFVQKVSGNSTSYVLRYYAWSADVSVTGIYIGFSMCIGNCSWKSLTFDQSRETVIEVGDFTTINELWPASVEQTPGNVVSFYTGAEVYSQPEASETKYVGFVILDTDFANTKTATVIAYGQNIGKQYIGKLEYEAQSIDWYPLTYASRLTNAVKVTAFTESSLSSLLSSWKTGDVVPFTTNSVTASTTNQFPESGIFNGFISMGSNEGDYFQIFAFKSGSTKAYLGACIGSTTQWTALEGGGAQTVIKLPGLDVELNQNNGDIIPYASTELAKLSSGVTLMLCFGMADTEGRFSPSGNVVVYYDLPSPQNYSWDTIAGFFDNATSSNSSINVRRRAAGVLDFQCTSGLSEGYPGLQVYLKHIFVLG
nr:MAG TPA: hypothetical protein [Caudoviricetes sp.]